MHHLNSIGGRLAKVGEGVKILTAVLIGDRDRGEERQPRSEDSVVVGKRMKTNVEKK